MEKEIRIAKQIITEEINRNGLEIKEFILFGSRAKGNFSKSSDWDFLVILTQDIPFQEMKRITADIQMKLAAWNIPNDLVLRSINQFEVSKTIVGNISYFANKEGIKI